MRDLAKYRDVFNHPQRQYSPSLNPKFLIHLHWYKYLACRMANSFSSLHYHVVFSTKNREAWIREEIESRVWSYLGGVARENEMKALAIGGIENHVHLLLGIPPKISVSHAIKLIKGSSSAWMKEALPGMAGFAWQDGYAAFTVSQSKLMDVDKYIRNQRKHHRIKTFEEEYRAFLKCHEFSFKEEYLLG